MPKATSSDLQAPPPAKQYSCPTCGSNYSRVEFLRRHQRTHTETKPFQCEYCQKRYARSDVLYRHRRKCATASQNNEEPLEAFDPSPAPPAPRTSQRAAKTRADARPYPSVDDEGNPLGRIVGHDAGPSSSHSVVLQDFLEIWDRPGHKSHNPPSNSPPPMRSSSGSPESSPMDSPELSSASGSNTTLSDGSSYHSKRSSKRGSNESLTYQYTDSPRPLSSVFPDGTPFPSYSPNGTRGTESGTNLFPGSNVRESYHNLNNFPSQGSSNNNWGYSPSNNGGGQMLSLNDLVAAVATLSGDPSSFWNTPQNPSGISQDGQPTPVAVPVPGEWFPAPSGGMNFSGIQGMGVDIDNMGLGVDLNLGSGINLSVHENSGNKHVPGDRDADDPFRSERVILLSENSLVRSRAGVQALNPEHLFYFDPEPFKRCYAVHHWGMPDATKLSALASRTYHNLLGHLGVIHMPTFKLSDQHAWVIFAMCTTNTPASQSSHSTPAGSSPSFTDSSSPGASSSSDGASPILTQALDDLDGMGDVWARNSEIIRREKTDTLVKMYCREDASGNVHNLASDTLPLVHALLLYNSAAFLSEDPSRRLAGELFLSTITHIARQSGLFNPGADCTKTATSMSSADAEIHWKKWIRNESYRRTAWLVYTLDTLASLEANAVPGIPPKDIRHIPLPYANHLWSAPCAKAWATAMDDHVVVGITLDQAMTCIVGPPCSNGKMLHNTMLGPYGRLILILTILRGLIELGQGRVKGGYITQRWVVQKKDNGEVSFEHESIIAAYSHSLSKWRQGWDFDAQCHPNYRGSTFVNDATPYYWLCMALVQHLSPPPPPFCRREGDDGEHDDGPNRLEGLNLKDMLAAARQFVNQGEGLGIPA